MTAPGEKAEEEEEEEDAKHVWLAGGKGVFRNVGVEAVSKSRSAQRGSEPQFPVFPLAPPSSPKLLHKPRRRRARTWLFFFFSYSGLGSAATCSARSTAFNFVGGLDKKRLIVNTRPDVLSDVKKVHIHTYLHELFIRRFGRISNHGQLQATADQVRPVERVRCIDARRASALRAELAELRTLGVSAQASGVQATVNRNVDKSRN
jgi:hypothetical protein